MRKLSGIFLFLFLISFVAEAQVISGVVHDEKGQPVPGVNVVIKNTYTGVVADQNGDWKMQVRPGKYVLVFSLIGFTTVEKEVLVQSSIVEIETVLQQSVTQLNEALIVADTRDLARDIMQQVRKHRKEYINILDVYTCNTYRKQSLMRDDPKSLRDSINKATGDSLKSAAGFETLSPKQKRKARRFERKLKRHKVKLDQKTSSDADTMRVQYISSLNERVAQLTVFGQKSFETIDAEDEYLPRSPENYIYMSIGYDEEGLQIDNMQYVYHNEYLIFKNASDWDFNFYLPTLKKDILTIQPLVSPLSPMGPTVYRYDYAGLTYDDSVKVFRIKVTPVYPNDALFSGYIGIRDSSFSLYDLDLEINTPALSSVNEFRIRQKYGMAEPGKPVPVVTQIEYKIKEGKSEMTTTATSWFSGYRFNADSTDFKRNSLEIQRYDPQAFNRDSLWWTQHRVMPLSHEELKYVLRVDSMNLVLSSDSFLYRIDSIYNRIDIWRILLQGISHRNRTSGFQYYIYPLVSQPNFFGIGGYRHSVGFNVEKRFNNDFLLETETNLNYGFNNHDLRGRLGAGITYVPLKFVRTFVRFGDYYDMVNNNPSISSAFSRGNYARTKMFSISQRMEIVNGLFGELTFEHSDQQAISNMQMDGWSNQLFGSINQPIDFDRYVKSEFRLNLVYRIRQRYMIKGKRKILLGSKWPDITFMWRKGIPGLINSEVDFDYIEFGASDYVKLNRWGVSNWSFLMGSYVNKSNLRILEYKYFRGSDPFFFSNPMQSFQLLGPTLSSSSAYIMGNYIHHFDGAILGKVPLLSKLKLSLAGGGGFLLMEENGFRHGEVFFGLEKPFRIRLERFRVGLYAVTSDNNFEKAVFTFKVGISTFNTFLRKWDY
ncbi:MAG: hypothetical protein CVU11_08660 [Bacteroidetes bacterium HGW-Bacteroidetes-6]|jgi:hypothetical protein|nr:MAG: hypothetical protein CVU11_08660 [Bacteroidetes bacterium HGW-Bacteroidetes-6]